MTAAVRRCEVWLAELDKIRPVVVLTRDPLGRLLHSVIIAPVTATIRSLSRCPLAPAMGLGNPPS